MGRLEDIKAMVAAQPSQNDGDMMEYFQWTVREIERLQAALRDVQWKTMSGRMGTSAYPTCVGCGAKSHGALSAQQHSPDCKIENALRPKTKTGKGGE